MSIETLLVRQTFLNPHRRTCVGPVPFATVGRVKTAARSADDLADDWLSTGPLATAAVGGAPRAYPKRSELRRAEARAAGRRGADRRPAGGRPSGPAGTHAPPAPTSSARTAEALRRQSSGFAPARLPIAVSPTPAVLPIRQTSSPYRPAGIDLPVPPAEPSFDAFHQTAPRGIPMVPIAVPAPPMAPAELAAPVLPALDPALWGLDIEAAPATGRRRGADEAEQARRGRAPKSPATTGLPRLLGRGKSGAARLLVLALVVGAEGVAVTAMSGTARVAPHDPSTAGVNSAFELAPVTVAAGAAATVSTVPSAGDSRTTVPASIDPLLLTQAQEASSGAKVTAAIAQAKAAAARIRLAEARRDRAMRNAQSDPKPVAQIMVTERGWGSSQFSCLVSLWNRESMWNYRATNPSSGAYGIAQALPGSKMASAGADWRTNPVTQIRWGLDYIADRYGTPCGAWGHSQATGWY